LKGGVGDKYDVPGIKYLSTHVIPAKAGIQKLLKILLSVLEAGDCALTRVRDD